MVAAKGAMNQGFLSSLFSDPYDSDLKMGEDIFGSKPTKTPKIPAVPASDKDWMDGAQFPARTRAHKALNGVFLTWCDHVQTASPSDLPTLWEQAYPNAKFPTTDWFPIDEGIWMRHPLAHDWIFSCSIKQTFNQRGSGLAYNLWVKGPFKGDFSASRFGSGLKPDYEFSISGETPADVLARFALVVKEYQEPL